LALAQPVDGVGLIDAAIVHCLNHAQLELVDKKGALQGVQLVTASVIRPPYQHVTPMVGSDQTGHTDKAAGGDRPGGGQAPRLLDQVRDAVRRRHYSYRTEEAYVQWIKRFIYFAGKQHPKDVGAAEVTAFLNHLAVQRDVAAATQNQALSALLFLYREVLNQPLPWLDNLERAKRPARLPTVLSKLEVQRLLSQMTGTKWLMASLLYGAGLRLRECLGLRVKDVDFDYRQIVVRDGKGGKDRVTMLPGVAIEPLRQQLVRVKALHERDIASGHGDVELPDALARKYPNAPYQLHGSSCFPHTSSPPILGQA
jgi:integron integrase